MKKFEGLPIVWPTQPSSEKEEKFLREIIEYEFSNIEEPGLGTKFPYGNTRKNHRFTLLHGGKYSVPRHVARHVENCSTPLYTWSPNGSGGMEKKANGRKPRFQMRQNFSA